MIFAKLSARRQKRNLTLNGVQPPHHDSQKVVEVMRDTSCELAYRFQLLRLPQRGFSVRSAFDLVRDALLQVRVEPT